MIARLWTAHAVRARAPQYVDYFNMHVLPELAAIRGYEGAQVLTREQGADVEVVVITWWASLDAIRAFAGDTLETAVVHDAAAALLTGFDRHVRHYTVARREDRPQS